MHPTQPPSPVDEESYTPAYFAKLHKLHRETVIKLFVNEEGVIRLGHGPSAGQRRYYTLRIPRHVAERVFNRLRVRKIA
jgi:hypothetical protein